jgi:hypothetical protein
MHKMIGLMVSLMMLGCGDNGATGSVNVVVDGEDGARLGYPNGSGDEVIEFADEWSLSFDRVLVAVEEFHLRASDGDDALLTTDPVVVDLSSEVVLAHVFDSVPARRWDQVSYRVVPPTTLSRAIGVEPADLQRMVDAGNSLLLEGTATRGTESVAFSFGIPLTVRNQDCEAGDETAGLIVPEASTAEANLTIHFDHLFFDSYATEEPALRFDAIAAMAVDGGVTFEMLRGQSMTDVRDAAGEPIMDGTDAVVYDPGPLTVGGDTLYDYILAASSTTGHFLGEGHCDYEL